MGLYLHVHYGCLTLLCYGVSDVLGRGGQIADHVVHRGLVFQEERPDHARVQDVGTVPRHRGHAPYQEQALVKEQMTGLMYFAVVEGGAWPLLLYSHTGSLRHFLQILPGKVLENVWGEHLRSHIQPLQRSSGKCRDSLL